MNSGITAERVYNALKGRLLAGEFKPGERLDPALLSDTLSSSVTPVRDVLNVLKGEGLIEARTGEGFFRPHVTAPDLEDLYGWADEVALLSIRSWSDAQISDLQVADRDLTTRTASLYLAVAARSSNAEHERSLAGINDRLGAVRVAEASVLPDLIDELAAIERAFEHGDSRELARLIVAYYRRRRRAASDIVRAIYRRS